MQRVRQHVSKLHQNLQTLCGQVAAHVEKLGVLRTVQNQHEERLAKLEAYVDALGISRGPGARPNRQYETMTCMEWGPFTIRVWVSADALAVGPDHAVVNELEMHLPQIWKGWQTANGNELFSSFGMVAAILDKVPRVAGYEVLRTADKAGGLVYPDWG